MGLPIQLRFQPDPGHAACRSLRAMFLSLASKSFQHFIIFFRFLLKQQEEIRSCWLLTPSKRRKTSLTSNGIEGSSPVLAFTSNSVPELYEPPNAKLSSGTVKDQQRFYSVALILPTTLRWLSILHLYFAPRLRSWKSISRCFPTVHLKTRSYLPSISASLVSHFQA